jgi:hypothetical protein
VASIPIQLQFPDPPTILTQREALPGNPYSGPLQFIDRVRGPIGTDAFGIDWLVTVTPPGIGSTIDTDVTFDRDIIGLREVKEDIGSTLISGPQTLIREIQGRMYFSEFPLTRLALWVYPFCEINLWWVLVL